MPTATPQQPPIADADDPTASLKDRAWALYCHGYRSPAIARQLGVPDRTIRSWLDKILSSCIVEHQNLREHRLVLAIQRQRGIAVAAWEGYERAAATEAEANAKLAALADEDDNPALARTARQALAAGARYLAIAASAERELARLQNLYSPNNEPAPPVVWTVVRRPDGADGAGIATTHTTEFRPDGTPIHTKTVSLVPGSDGSTEIKYHGNGDLSAEEHYAIERNGGRIREDTGDPSDKRYDLPDTPPATWPIPPSFRARDDDGDLPIDPDDKDNDDGDESPSSTPKNENAAKMATTPGQTESPAWHGHSWHAEETKEEPQNATSANTANAAASPAIGEPPAPDPYRVPKRREIHFAIPVANYYGGFGPRW